ncbi:MAG: hypothetical protein Q9184_002179 [Pyrenodesmia sp. 2 TL-2023]
MPPRATKDLVLALLEQLPQDSSPAVIVVKPDRPPTSIKTNGHQQGIRGPQYDPSLVYVLELITLLAVRDESTLAAVGELVVDALQNIIRNAANTHFMVLSRAVFYLLLLLQKSAIQDQSLVRPPVVLHMISSFSQPKLEKSAALILKGLIVCIKESGTLRNEIINTPDFWSTIERIHTMPAVSAGVFSLLKAVVEDGAPAVTADNYEFVIGLLNSFANAGGAAAASQQQREPSSRRPQPQEQAQPRGNDVFQRGEKAVDLVYQLTSRVTALIEQSHLERNDAWITYWSPIFECLRIQCENPHRGIRRRAFTCLQGALQSAELASTDHQEWTAIFSEVLFPLIERLLKPEVYQADLKGMSETRVAVAKLLCKIFLHYLVTLAEWEGMEGTWFRILDCMDRLMNSGQGSGMEEEISESLKNILYFMKSDGYLVPPPPEEKDAPIWHETWKRVDKFLPGMRKEIFPDPPPPQQKQQHPAEQNRLSTEQAKEVEKLAETRTEEL